MTAILGYRSLFVNRKFVPKNPISYETVFGLKPRNHGKGGGLFAQSNETMEAIMGFGRGALLWLIGIPLPIILLLALFMHH
jgi:hypothetical protein